MSARVTASATVVLSILLGGLPVPGPAESASDPPLARVAVAGSPAELMRSAVAPLGDGDGVILIAPGLQYYGELSRSARKLRVVHVTPGREPLSAAQFEGWKKALPAPLESASFRDGTISGRLGDMELSVVGLPQMTIPSERCVVVLDPGFFLPLYENEVRGGMIDLSMKLYRTLSEKKAVGFPLVVIDPLSNTSLPLQWTYLAELWKDVWNRSDGFKDDLPRRWKMRKESEFLAEFGQFEEAARLLDDARPLFPNDGSLDFQLARMSFWERDVPVGLRFLNRAARTDKRFLRGYFEFGEYLVSKERLPAAEMVYRAGLLLEKDSPALNLGLMRLLLERAEALQAVDTEEARKDLNEALSLRVPEEMKKRARATLEKIESRRPR